MPSEEILYSWRNLQDVFEEIFWKQEVMWELLQSEAVIVWSIGIAQEVRGRSGWNLISTHWRHAGFGDSKKVKGQPWLYELERGALNM